MPPRKVLNPPAKQFLCFCSCFLYIIYDGCVEELFLTDRMFFGFHLVPSLVSSPGVVKIVVRQTAGKEGGPVPTLAVAPSPRAAPQTSPSPHANTTPVRNTAPLHIAQRTPGPATAHYTIAPPRNLTSTPNQPQPPRPVLKLVQPLPSGAEQTGKRTTFSCCDS